MRSDAPRWLHETLRLFLRHQSVVQGHRRPFVSPIARQVPPPRLRGSRTSTHFERIGNEHQNRPADAELLNDFQRRMQNTTAVLTALDQMLGSAVVARGRYTTVLKVNTADYTGSCTSRRTTTHRRHNHDCEHRRSTNRLHLPSVEHEVGDLETCCGSDAGQPNRERTASCHSRPHEHLGGLLRRGEHHAGVRHTG